MKEITKTTTLGDGTIKDEFFYMNGKLAKVVHYKNDSSYSSLHGDYIEWDEDGNLIYKANFVNDLREGLVHIYEVHIKTLFQFYCINDLHEGEMVAIEKYF